MAYRVIMQSSLSDADYMPCFVLFYFQTRKIKIWLFLAIFCKKCLISAYQECEFLILPSRWELSPLVPLEGFAFKKTIISTDTDGIPYTVKNNVNGLLFPQEDFQELSKLILELVTNIEKRNSLGLAGYDMFQNESNSKIMSKKTLDVYQNITKTAN